MVKILWVDDEVELLKPHVLFLRQKGYEVDTCNNGYDAIDMASEEPYDLMYIHYLMARVALWNGETERYNQFAALFEETYAAYRADTSRNAAWKDGRKIQM